MRARIAALQVVKGCGDLDQGLEECLLRFLALEPFGFPVFVSREEFLVVIAVKSVGQCAVCPIKVHGFHYRFGRLCRPEGPRCEGWNCTCWLELRAFGALKIVTFRNLLYSRDWKDVGRVKAVPDNFSADFCVCIFVTGFSAPGTGPCPWGRNSWLRREVLVSDF